VDLGIKALLLVVEFFDGALDDALLVLQLLVRVDQLSQVRLVLFAFGFLVSDVLFEFLGFFLTSLALRSGHVALHELNLVVGVVDQFLLARFLVLELGDVGLQVARGGQRARNVADQVGLLSPQLEQDLRLLKQFGFLKTRLLLNFFFHFFSFFESLLSHLVHLLNLLLGGFFLRQAFLVCRVFLLGGIQSLHPVS